MGIDQFLLLGAVGIAMLQTFLTKRGQYHSNVLSQSVSGKATRRGSISSRNISSITAFSIARTPRNALVAIGHIVQKQAYILAFSDTFYLLAICSAPCWSLRSWQPCC